MADLVPTVDIADPTATSLDELDRACADHGFFLISGHRLDDLIERAWTAARAFFSLGPDAKQALGRTADLQLGYHDRELTKRLRDHKEVFDFADPAGPDDTRLNRWPSGVPGFRPTMTELFDACADLTAMSVKLVHRALGLPPASAVDHTFSRSASSLRLNHYPTSDPVPPGDRDGLRPLGGVALGDHTDPGVITLLLQDATGGLQTASREHGWIDVPPRPGTIVVNLGDVMQVWTNDRYRAAVHRVTPMGDRDRLSIPFFANPTGSTVVEPIDRLAGGRARYRPFPWGEFMQARMDDNYRDLGTDDTQISDYAIGGR